MEIVMNIPYWIALNILEFSGTHLRHMHITNTLRLIGPK